jgi:hypothetical protein
VERLLWGVVWEAQGLSPAEYVPLEELLAGVGATLRALARLHGVATDDPALFALAAELGADVPACLLGQTARGEG